MNHVCRTVAVLNGVAYHVFNRSHAYDVRCLPHAVLCWAFPQQLYPFLGGSNDSAAAIAVCPPPPPLPVVPRPYQHLSFCRSLLGRGQVWRLLVGCHAPSRPVLQNLYSAAIITPYSPTHPRYNQNRNRSVPAVITKPQLQPSPLPPPPPPPPPPQRLQKIIEERLGFSASTDSTSRSSRSSGPSTIPMAPAP